MERGNSPLSIEELRSVLFPDGAAARKPVYKPHVVPETPGSIKELFPNVSAAHAALRNFAKKDHSALRDAIERKELPQEVLLGVQDWGNQPDQLDFREQISQDEKKQIFNPAIEAMKSFAGQHGIALPDNLIQRVTILKQSTIFNISNTVDFNHHEDDIDGAFTILYSRLSFINDDLITLISEVIGTTKEDLIQMAGVHELWHSVEYVELWQVNDIPPDELTPVRRSGMVTSRPEGARVDYSPLAEGFTEYLTRETLRLLNKPFFTNSYKDELEIIDILIGQIGLDPLIQATFSKKGFRALFNALEQRFGRGAFIKIGEALMYDRGVFISKSREGNAPSARYPTTKEFLQKEK